VQVGSIAGTRRLGLGAIVTRAKGSSTEPSDGLVNVSETRLPGLADHLVMDTAHSTMVVSSRVAQQVVYFLRQGRFAR
jgi:hypothetical protein